MLNYILIYTFYLSKHGFSFILYAPVTITTLDIISIILGPQFFLHYFLQISYLIDSD